MKIRFHPDIEDSFNNLVCKIGDLLTKSAHFNGSLHHVLEIINSHRWAMDCFIYLNKYQETSKVISENFFFSNRGLLSYENLEKSLAKIGRIKKPCHLFNHDFPFPQDFGFQTSHPIHESQFLVSPIRNKSENLGIIGAAFSPKASVETGIFFLSSIASMLSLSIQLESHQLGAANLATNRVLQKQKKPQPLIGNSRAMQAVFDLISQVTRSDTNALIIGESGVGKELVANAIHFNSDRCENPIVKVNCAALPDTLLESELFGYEKGAFTGALSQKKGRFETAEGGTIFLDEVGDFSPSIQVKLLRVLQENEFERVGGTQSLKTNVRIITATNRNLEKMINNGLFRQDLYYHLNVFPIPMAPLRERKTDILLLANHFAEKYNHFFKKEIKRISTPAIDMLMSYHWPGNIRELENCIERAVLIATDRVIHSQHLPPTLQTAEASNTDHSKSLRSTLDAVERDVIIDSLKSSKGNVAKAARKLGVTERIMGLRVRKFRINTQRFREKTL